MKFAVLSFPGSNCEKDSFYALKDVIAEEVSLVSYQAESLAGFDAVVVPGGFSYGDYLRSGALARFAPIIPALKEFAAAGKPVLGICNGFQILTEAGLLPGTLQKNIGGKFVCRQQKLVVKNAASPFSTRYQAGQVITLPIAHGDGNYYADEKTLQELEENGQIIFKYQDNPNGSLKNIAGITNKTGNVLGMMPHPERAVEEILGSADGVQLFQSLIAHFEVAAHE
ncbi:phosphoribosylformylglycinamidine synthase subunit PurQ [Ligilactobacillus acidipiscis]|uniref:phosphoribosylformylglycinamidine synthase subunit PurQ n=1 Tax=Ligilactobacillus acidipiscis TaxID=89059 RepID=UPI0023F8240C|nr:phosphoribosylformylglycinamidine synthase subunit PurQ [Ligilactobacillus acidipiscis]WEV58153.1 phosphoribosylformylglycinamidine synthase subunit PurQ [Ligilactobacillus acidipiscis]